MTQLAIDFSRSIGEQAAEACASKAERVSDFDREGAAEWIRNALLISGPMSGEALTEDAKKAGFVPHLDKAFGPVFQSLARKKLIRVAGFAPRARGNGSPGYVWAAVV